MLPFLLVLVLSLSSKIEAKLDVGFYNVSCPKVQSIIKEEVEKAFYKDRGIAPGLVRLHFHDCFVKGCDGSILIKSTRGNSAEEDGPPNAGTLRGIKVIERAKARLEKECKGVVSCADILAYAARDSIVITKGLGWDVPAGRRDGRISRASDTIDIPPPSFNLEQSIQAFAKRNISQDDMIALLGVHTIGQSHCTSFSDRLYNFNSTSGQDPTLNPSFASKLKHECPRRAHGTVDPKRVVQMNSSPSLFDNSFYKDVLKNRVLFTSDQTMTSTPHGLSEVKVYAGNNTQWLVDFADAMVNLSQVDVLTGNAGEIRCNCRVINK